MDEKREIGKKIWELFLKNYSYGEIAKRLGVSKSLVSNIINYSLPSTTWTWENVKKVKEKYEQEIQEKDEQIQDLKEELTITEQIANTTIFTAIIYIVATTILLFSIKIDFYHNFKHILGFIVYSILLIAVIFFALYYYFSEE